MHWIDKVTTPIIFGHRGASKYAPENTITAFNLSLQQGAEAFELDTMLTADGIPVVIHDRTVDRTTNGTGKVDQLMIEQLQMLDAGTRFSPTYSGEKIPLLEEIFTLYKDKALINVELKNYHNPTDDLPGIVIELAKKKDVLNQIIFSSFLPSNLRRINRYYPEACVALLCSGGLTGFLQRSILFSSVSPDYIHPYFKDVSKLFLNKQQNMHRRINTWTVNNKDDIVCLIKWGVNGIITDDPKTAVEVKNEMKLSI
jgi:glycerophosphoryl diester phosphodiesterase